MESAGRAGHLAIGVRTDDISAEELKEAGAAEFHDDPAGLVSPTDRALRSLPPRRAG
jgi:hypothetical protein